MLDVPQMAIDIAEEFEGSKIQGDEKTQSLLELGIALLELYSGKDGAREAFGDKEDEILDQGLADQEEIDAVIAKVQEIIQFQVLKKLGEDRLHEVAFEVLRRTREHFSPTQTQQAEQQSEQPEDVGVERTPA